MKTECIRMTMTCAMRPLRTGINHQLLTPRVNHHAHATFGKCGRTHGRRFMGDSLKAVGSIPAYQPQSFFGQRSGYMLEIAALEQYGPDREWIKKMFPAITVESNTRPPYSSPKAGAAPACPSVQRAFIMRSRVSSNQAGMSMLFRIASILACTRMSSA